MPTASFTVTKLRWLAEHEPASASRAAAVLLPHDWLTWRLLGGMGERSRAAGHPGRAPSGPGPRAPDGHRPGRRVGHRLLLAREGELAARPGQGGGRAHARGCPGWRARARSSGRPPWGAAVSAGTGDNMGAALGLGLGPGDVAVSIGTSGTAFAVSEVPAADPSGAVAGFADATGRFLPLVCTINAGLVLSATASLLGTDLDGLSALALAAEPGAGGITLLPYLDGERTPDRPGATGVLRGLTTRNATRENLARAAVEALLASLADAADRLAAACARARRRRRPAAGAADRRRREVGRGPRARAGHLLLAGRSCPSPRSTSRSAPRARPRGRWPGRPGAAAVAAAARGHATPARPSPQIRERHAALRDDTATWDERTGS